MWVGEETGIPCKNWVDLQLCEAEKRPNEIAPNRELAHALRTALLHVALDLIQVFNEAGTCLDESRKDNEWNAEVRLTANVACILEEDGDKEGTDN